MRAAKVDANHSAIVKALRQAGCSVQSLAAVGRGCPDLLIYAPARREHILAEVKDGSKPPSARELTPDQCEWHCNWRGPVQIVTSVDEALAMVRDEPIGSAS